MINEKSEEFSNSQFALKAYMNFKDSNAYMHEAMVLFPANGKSVNGIFKIYPKIDTNLKSRYTNKDSIFRFINGALIISSKDIWGNPIEIDVSAI